MSNASGHAPTILVIGSGFAGIGLGIRLKKAGFENFIILEKGARLGGTWRDNVYPGAACDSPSFHYCFSFEQKTDWSRKWAPQPEILEYIEHCATKYGVLPHVQFETEVESARFDEERGLWHVCTTAGETLTAKVLVSAVGQLNRPRTPQIEGLDRFRGEAFHSARWNHDYDLAGKNVAVVGTAASAVQFVPVIAPKVEKLWVFQRSPNWMLPKNDRRYTEREKSWLGKIPLLARLYRWWIWLLFELRFPVLVGQAFAARIATKLATDHLENQVSDPDLKKALVPDYPVGAKRILISDDYYPALERPNVRLITDPIDHIAPDAVVTQSNAAYPADAIIFATGFDSTSFLVPMRIEGSGGQSLRDAWQNGAEAYLGMTVAGFPNFFMMYGPNTNLGHNSIIFMLECQARYIVDAIRRIEKEQLKYIDLRRDVMAAYNARLAEELARTVWASIDESWYKTASGRITNNWSSTTTRYWWKTRRADLSLYHRVARDREPATEGQVAPYGTRSGQAAASE